MLLWALDPTFSLLAELNGSVTCSNKCLLFKEKHKGRSCCFQGGGDRVTRNAIRYNKGMHLKVGHVFIEVSDE